MAMEEPMLTFAANVSALNLVDFIKPILMLVLLGVYLRTLGIDPRAGHSLLQPQPRDVELHLPRARRVHRSSWRCWRFRSSGRDSR